MKITELLCLEFNSKGMCVLRKFRKSELLREIRNSMKNYFQKLQLFYSNLIRKKIEDFFFKLIHEDDKSGLLKFFREALQIRDVRQVDPAFSAKPTLWVRCGVILVSLEQIRAIILHNKLFLFDPDNPKIQKGIKVVSERLYKIREKSMNLSDIPYEFRALDGVFVNVCVNLEKDFTSLEPTILENLDELPTKLTSRQLEELRAFKQRLSQFSARAQNVQRVLQEILEDDDNMINMHLSKKNNYPVNIKNPGDHGEIEILAENYLQVVDHLTNRAKLLDNAVDDTEDLVTIKLDTIRNRILFVELTLSIISLSFAAGSLVAGIFGMNLSIPVFKDENFSKVYFFVCIFFISSSVAGLYWWLFRWCKNKGLYTS